VVTKDDGFVFDVTRDLSDDVPEGGSDVFLLVVKVELDTRRGADEVVYTLVPEPSGLPLWSLKFLCRGSVTIKLLQDGDSSFVGDGKRGDRWDEMLRVLTRGTRLGCVAGSSGVTGLHGQVLHTPTLDGRGGSGGSLGIGGVSSEFGDAVIITGVGKEDNSDGAEFFSTLDL
jgi:hypothetical protein